MTEYIAGVDIGNATTETALGRLEEDRIVDCVSGIYKTTGVKGTKQNLVGIINSLEDALKRRNLSMDQLSLIRINEATPVIGDFAMETITETIITESTLIGHNPDTPGGVGIGVGITVDISQLVDLHEQSNQRFKDPVVLVVSDEYEYDRVAEIINGAIAFNIEVVGAILRKDDGVLVSNRLNKNIPILDEVEYIEKVPLGMKCAVEVAPQGSGVDLLSNPYGIATVFELNSEETKQVVYVAKALIGNRSAVVIKTPKGDIKERKIPAGQLIIHGQKRNYKVEIGSGADEIMSVVNKAGIIKDVEGEKGTNVGGMIEKVRNEMAKIIEDHADEISIKDLFAINTIVPREVSGNLAREFSMEQAVGLAAMVKTRRLHMEKLAELLSDKLNIRVEIGGVEGEMAIKGALTTPGTGKPLVVVDIGAGSTDACVVDKDGGTKAVHLAGAGNMVTMIIDAELGLNSFNTAEEIKKYPLAKVESLFHLRHEDGSVEFFKEPLDSGVFARVVLVTPFGYKPIKTTKSLEQIKQTRKSAKEKVLVRNIIRALENISITGNVNEFEHVVLVGGSSLDFELGNMVTDALSYHGITAGKANIRGTEGPRNAVATGLLYSRES